MDSQTTAREFLALPVEALPSARFADEDDSWARDAWQVLRDVAATGQSATDLCGTPVVVSADRPDWRHVVVD